MEPNVGKDGQVTDQPVGDKSGLRAQIRARRRIRMADPTESRALAQRISDLLGVPTAPVASYLAMASEPPTQEVNSLLGRVLVPRTSMSIEPTLEWVEFQSGDPVSRSRLGMDEPTGPAVGVGAQPLLDCAAVIIPSVAIDFDGRRLGQGGGYYDRVLADLPVSIPVITLLFDDEIVDDVFAEPYDANVDVCITPNRILRFSR